MSFLIQNSTIKREKEIPGGAGDHVIFINKDGDIYPIPAS